jgi:hypothetical protein
MSQEVKEPTSAECWARRVLRVSPEATPDAVRKALCNQIEEDGFHTGGAAREAMEVVVHGTGRWATAAALPCWSASLETEFDEELQGFVREYFTLEPAERQTRWQDLKRRSASYPRLQARLAMLETGLSTPSQPPANATPQVQAMMRGLMVIYLAPPAQRAQALRDFEAPPVVDHAKSAARQIQRSYPQWSRLEPTMITHLAGEKPPVRIERVAARPAPAVEESSNRIPAAMIIFLVIGFLRFMAAGSGRSPQYDVAPQVKYPSNYPKYELEPSGETMTPEKLRELILGGILKDPRGINTMRDREAGQDSDDSPATAEVPGEPLPVLEIDRQMREQADRYLRALNGRRLRREGEP